MATLEITALSELMGGEIVDFGCRQPPHVNTRDAIVDALYRFQVLVFRDQELTPEQQIAFSETFGPLEIHVNQENTAMSGQIFIP